MLFPPISQRTLTDKYQQRYVKKIIGHWSQQIPHVALYLALSRGELFAEMIFEDQDSTTLSSQITTSDSFQILLNLTMDLVTVKDESLWKALEIQEDPLVLTGCAILPLHDLHE